MTVTTPRLTKPPTLWRKLLCRIIGHDNRYVWRVGYAWHNTWFLMRDIADMGTATAFGYWCQRCGHLVVIDEDTVTQSEV